MPTEFTLLKCLAGLPRTERGIPMNLSGDPKGKNFLYCNGNSVFIRDIQDSSECDVYTQHAKDTTAAAYSPSGFYICSGDMSGKIRIWDTVNEEHLLKNEFPVIGGSIHDIAWTEDSKRIAVCGAGRENFAVAIMWDTGTSVGALNGPGKLARSITIKQNRPYRLAVGSDDFSSFFYEGPPFKLKTENKEHTNFVNCARFSPDGTKLATGGADGKLIIYDGKTGELLGQMCEAAGRVHKGGIYGMSWSPDSKQIMTCSGDKTVKVWNLDEKYYLSNKESQGTSEEENGLHCTFKIGDKVDDMQVACLWLGNQLISVSLNGHINYLDLENPGSPSKVIKGHNKSLTASCLNDDRSLLFTASYDGLVCCWDLATGVAEVVEGKRHNNQVQSLSCKGNTVVSCAMDDSVRFINVDEKKYIDEVIQLDSQPQAVAIGDMGLVVVACLKEVVVIQDRKITNRYKNSDYEATAIAINSSLGKVLVGTDASSVLIFDIEGDQLKESGQFPTNEKVTDIKFSPDNQFVAVSSAKKQVKIVETSDFRTEKANWGTHAGKVSAVAWTPDSRHLGSCGVDGVVNTYNVEQAKVEAIIRGAHSQSVNGASLLWKDNNTLMTTGRKDCSTRLWQIKH